MKLKLSVLTLLFLSSLTPLPAQASIWDFIRNSVAVSYVFGKPTEVNYTAQTRLPIIEEQLSFWSRITNFFAWRNFQATNQPQAEQPVAPAPAPEQLSSNRLSEQAAEHLVNRLDVMRAAHEAKKLAELAVLEENDRIIANIREKADSLKLDLEKARSEADHNKKGWTALSNHTRDQDKLIESKQKELSGLAEQKKIAESEAQRLKEAAAAKRNEEIILLQAQQLREKELTRAQKEKVELISRIEQEQKESALHFYNKNITQEELRKLQRAVEETDKRNQAKFEELLQKILRLKNELKETRDAKENSLEALHTTKRAITHLETNLKTLTLERDSLHQALAESRAQKDSLAFQLRELESKYSTDQKKTKNDFDAAKKAHEQTKKDLEKSQQQASVAISSSIELNKQLGKKNEEIQNVQQVYNAEITEIQQLLGKKRSEIDLLLAKLEREEKEKSHTLQTITSAIVSFETEQNKKISHFKNAVTHKLQGTEHRIRAIQAKLPRVSKIVPQLPVILEKSEETDFERQSTARASLNYSAIEINQSTLATSAMPNPGLNKSIIGEEVEQFIQLSHTPSPDLPLAAGQSNESESIYQHIQIDPAHYLTKAQKGRAYLQQITQGNFLQQLKSKTPDEHLEVIEAILYRLHQNASYKGQGFLEGTYVIQDTENFDVYNTLMSYVQKVNRDVTGDLKDPLAHVSLNPFAYPRDASHYVHNKHKHRYYGIDLRRSDYSTFSIPGDHAHLLLGLVDKDKRLIFIKPEHKGIYILDGWLGHCNEFITAQTRKNNMVAKSVRWVASWLGYEITTDDNDLYRKERIPAEFVKQFGLILAQEEALTADQKQQLTSKAKLLGIQTLADDQIVKSEAFQQMKNAYRAKYDNLEHRSGREVHCNLQQLITLEQ